MPDRTISILSFAVGILIAGYLALVVTTVSLAAWRTDLAAEVRDAENGITTLERSYYDAIAEIGRTDPGTVGLVAPAEVRYAAMVAAPSLSLR
ncbi:MAG TPA: hypothetical protein VHO23_02985 [Candidatus Paceibacterota bacterium]|nr:hypothetical protein [Candidatus Paceibacterota bacterium]